jgi:uncharacterized protein YjaZ
MYATRVHGVELERVKALAQPLLNEPFPGWDEWFFGEREPEIPLHAGYSLGYLLVSNWLRKHGSTAAIEHTVQAERVLADA